MLACQSAHQGFLAPRVHSDPGPADWDWTPVWRCLLESPAPRGSPRLGLWERKKSTERLSLGKLHALNYNDSFLFVSKDYFLLSSDKSFILREGYLRMCWKRLRSGDESTKTRKDKLAGVCETRQYPCPVVKNELTSTSAAPSANTQTGISNTDIFMRASTHTYTHTHVNTHLQYSYNTLRHGRMRVK